MAASRSGSTAVSEEILAESTHIPRALTREQKELLLRCQGSVFTRELEGLVL